ncbi:MAG: hypothetical protein R3C18_11075 [Planctomycetaceae bacterium]
MRIVYGTVAYLVVTFPLAYVWHLVLFKETYDSLGYFSREEPIVLFGFFAILLQGILLSILYPYVCPNMSVSRGAMRFAALLGGYHWTMHVLAEAAKHQISPLPTWFALESGYLMIQFALGGLLMALVYRVPQSPAPAEP